MDYIWMTKVFGINMERKNVYIDIHVKSKSRSNIKNQNKFLTMVKDDYNNYKNVMGEQQRVQDLTMGVLEKSVEGIPNELNQQRKLLHEIGNIRKKIDELIKIK